MEQLTDQQMLERANTIKTETEAGANTAFRIGTILENLVVNKPNITTLSNVNNTSDAQKVASGPIKDALDDKYDASNPSNFITFAEASGSAPIQTVAGKTGNVTLNKSDVGLAFVDNTSDLNKPVSTATQSALDLKVNTEVGKSLTTNDYTNIDKNKLDAIEAGAQVNTVETADLANFETTTELNTRDTNNRNRTNHTGTQAISTVTNLQSTLDGKELASNKVTTLTGANNTTYPTSAAVANALQDVASGESYQGSWNASTNTPTLTSSSGTDGHYYQVTVAGTTNLDGETNWELGDQAIFKDGVWLRRENFAVTSWAGKTGVVVPEISDITGLQTALNDKLEASDLTDYETSTQLNSRDTANRNRSNHTGSQTASTISDFNSAVSNNSAVSANTLKRSYPLVDQNKLSGIEAGAEVNDTAGEVKTKYESNLDTNAYTDAEKNKLSGIEAGAQVNQVSSLDIADFETTTQLNSRDTANRNTDNHVNGTNNKVFTAGEQTKLSGVAANANNYSHPNHTGDVTSDGDGPQTIASGVVSNDKLANMAANTLKIRIGTTGSPQDGTVAQTKTLLALDNVNNTSDADKPISTATQNALNTKLESADVANFETSTELNARDTANRSRVNHTGTQAISTVTNLQIELDSKLESTDIANFETTTELNARDTANRSRSNHTGSQLASTISDFQTQVSANSDVIANTAKRSYPSGDETKLAGIETGAEVNDTGVEIISKMEGVDPTDYFDLTYTIGGSVIDNTQFEGAGTDIDPIKISTDAVPTQNSTKFVDSGDFWQYEQDNPRGGAIPDGITKLIPGYNPTFEIANSTEDISVRDACSIDGNVFAVGSTGGNNRMLYSNDGVNFRNAGETTSLPFYGIDVAPHGTIIAVGRFASATNIRRSTDYGYTWTGTTADATHEYTGVRWTGGVWVAVSRAGTTLQRAAYSLDDGVTWSTATTNEDNTFNGIIVGGGKVFIFSQDGTNRVEVSDDYGITYTSITTITTNRYWVRGAFFKGNVVLLRGGSGSSPYLTISGDLGTTWSETFTPTDTNQVIEYMGVIGDYLYLVGAAGYMVKTTDLVTFTPVTSNTVNNLSAITLTNINGYPVINTFAQSGTGNRITTSLISI